MNRLPAWIGLLFPVWFILMTPSWSTWAQGPGNALQFDGVDDYVDISDDDSFTGSAITIEAWIYPDEVVGTERILLSKYNSNASDISWTLYKQADGRLLWQVHQDPPTARIIVQDAVTIYANQWQHIAATYEVATQNMYIYVNGSMTATTLTSASSLSSIYNGNTPVRIGSAVNAAGNMVQFWDGAIDELRVWNSFLDASQIRTRMHTQLTGSESGLVAYYRCDESSGNLDDGTNNNLDGVLMGGTTRGTSTAAVGAGYGNIQTVSTTGSRNFPTTNLLLNFTSKSGSDDFLSTLLNDSTAVGTLPTGSNIYTKKYWVLEKFGSGTFAANATFELGTGAISSADVSAPSNLKLYRRNANESGSWTLVGSASAATTASVTFNGLTQTGQYMIGTTGTSTFYSSGDILFSEFSNGSFIFSLNSPLDLGDFDNDGDLDVIVTGNDGSNIKTILYRNTNGTYNDANSSLQNLYTGGVQWGDYNNDGDLDIAILGSSTYISNPAVDGGTPALPIYKGNGTSSFTLDTNLSPIPLRNTVTKVVWGDYNFDGQTDLLAGGVLYKNRGGTGHTFDRVGHIPDSLWSSNYVSWCDYDGEGDLDFIYTAGYAGQSASTQLWRNDGSTFTHVLTPVDGSSDFPQLAEGMQAWGDYDNDGKPDLAICGTPDASSRFLKIYKNNGNGIFHDIGASLGGGVGVSMGALAWGDFDNDGWLDLIAFGYNATGPYNLSVYRNNRDGSFTNLGSVGISSVVVGNGAVGDYDKDGRLDFIMTGWNQSNQHQLLTACHNNTSVNPNAKPTAPVIRNTVPGADSVRISWDLATDNETPSLGLTYNIRMGTSPGGINIVSPMADVSTGLRKVARQGNAWHDTTIVMRNLANGTYYWAVQAIDNSYDGGAFSSEQSFSIGVPPLVPGTPAINVNTITNVTLSWSASAGTLTRYRIFRSTTSGTGFVQVDSTSDATNAKTHTLPVGGTYYFKIAAVNANGMSVQSGEQTVVTLAVEPAQAPTNFAASALAMDSLIVSFTAATGSPSGYLAIRKAGSIPAGVPTDGQSYTAGSSVIAGDSVVFVGSATTFTQKGLTSNTEYFYRIFSFNGTGLTTNYLTTSSLVDSVLTLTTRSLGVNKSSIAFGNVDKTTNQSRNDTIILSKSFANSDITFSSIAVTGTNASDFMILKGNPLPNMVNTNALERDTIVVQFTPSNFGSRSASLDITGNFDGSPLMVAMTGFGTGDLIKPNIGLPSANPATPSTNTAVTVSVSVSDNSGFLSHVVLEYRRGDQSSFSLDTMQLATGLYVGEIPASSVTKFGVVYRIRASDGSVDSTSRMYSVPVSLGAGEVNTSVSGTYSNGIPGSAKGQGDRGWRLFSIPLDLSPTLADLFESWGAEYRVFDEDGNRITTAQLQYRKGYWVKHLGGNQAFAVSLGAASVSLDSVLIPLESGWSLIGTPFPVQSVISLTKPAAASDLYRRTNADAYEPASIMEPFEGYWINNSGSQTSIVVYPRTSNPIAKVASKTDWTVQFKVRHDDLQEDHNFIGVVEGDIHNLPEIPTMGDYVNASFERSEGEGVKVYTLDFRPPSDLGYTWDMSATSSFGRAELELEWIPDQLPSGHVMAILDVSHNQVVDANQAGYRFRAMDRSEPVRFKIFVGTEEYTQSELAKAQAELPREFLLQQNYPNPFNPTTSIRYELAQAGEVSLTVYNMLGQRVRTLIGNRFQQTGRYTVSWDGKNDGGIQVASGIYLYRLAVGNYVRTRKMLLIK